jgi:DNA-binding transcriptional ArsR family regulator
MTEALTKSILHPVRIRILATGQLAANLPDVPQASLYRHISRLEAAGVLTVVEQRPVRGTLEKVFTVAEGIGILGGEEVASMNLADWEHAFGAFAASLLGQFGAYLKLPHADPIADRVGFQTTPVYLSDEELQQLALNIRAVLLPLLEFGPAPERRRRLLSTILMPDLELNDPGETP